VVKAKEVKFNFSPLATVSQNVLSDVFSPYSIDKTYTTDFMVDNEVNVFLTFLVGSDPNWLTDFTLSLCLLCSRMKMKIPCIFT